MKTKRASDAAEPSRYRRQHDAFITDEIEVDGVRTRVKRVQPPLERYANRRLIDERQLEAGVRLARDWHHARMQPRMVASYRDLIDCGGMPDPAADRTQARRRVASAVAAVGRIASNEVISACCLELPVGGHAAMEILRRGLDVLAEHYGL
jgi:hypothetical protein